MQINWIRLLVIEVKPMPTSELLDQQLEFGKMS